MQYFLRKIFEGGLLPADVKVKMSEELFYQHAAKFSKKGRAKDNRVNCNTINLELRFTRG